MTATLIFALSIGLVLWLFMTIYFSRNWSMALYGLICYLTISGLIAVKSNMNPIALQAKDFLFVLPAYLGFIPMLRQRLRFYGIPYAFSICSLLFALLVLLQMLNPHKMNPSILVGLIGAKVWLFYLPLVMLWYVHFFDPQRLAISLRLLLLTSWLPCLLGIAQRNMANIYGYEKTMTDFYGNMAERITLDFGTFSYGEAQVYRIPSTFTFIGGYIMFLLAVICLAYIGAAYEQHSKWRKFAWLTLALASIASLLSGARTAFVVTPALLLCSFVGHKGLRGAVFAGALVVLAWTSASLVTGLSVFDIAPYLSERTTDTVSTSPFRRILAAAQSAPFGIGTGVATNQARHVGRFSQDRLIGVESYYGRAIVELGLLGGLFLFVITLTPLFTAVKLALKAQDSRLRGMATAAAAYLGFIVIANGSSIHLDNEPTHIYYWMIIGLVFRLNAEWLDQRKHSGLAPIRLDHNKVGP